MARDRDGVAGRLHSTGGMGEDEGEWEGEVGEMSVRSVKSAGEVGEVSVRSVKSEDEVGGT